MTANFIRIRPLTLSDLARLYKVSRPTMRRWIKECGQEIGKRIGYFFNHHQVSVIIKRRGDPKTCKKGRTGKRTYD
ncbi:MAG: hypothetical protein ABIS36_10950 [Chryseolinea sp.]